MLQRSFKTADELGINQEQFDTLWKVMDLLENQDIPDNLFTMREVGSGVTASLLHVRIDELCKQPEKTVLNCGTPRCILGWCQTFSTAFKGNYSYESRHNQNGLGKLFYPFHSEIAWWDADREEAAVAIRNFLMTGKAWE
jgi:hypothetical protein